MARDVGRPTDSFMEKMLEESMENYKKGIEAMERIWWECVESDLKEREDIKNGKPVYFKGFVNLINSKDAPNKDI